MLKSWSIKNFKPIVDSGELQLAPVTVLAGRNSSGKSSLLQSILMIAQTLGSRLLDRPLITNGTFVQLGTFENVINEYHQYKNISLSFELNFVTEETLGKFSYELTNNFKVKVSFTSANEGANSLSAIEASKIFVSDVSINVFLEDFDNWLLEDIGEELEREDLEEILEEAKETVEIRFSLRKLTTSEVEPFLENIIPDHLYLASDRSSYYIGDFESDIDEFADEPYLVALSHFFPSRFIQKFNIVERYQTHLKRFVDILFSPGNSFLLRHVKQLQVLDLTMPIPTDLKQKMNILCEERGIERKFSGETVGELAEWYVSLKSISGGKKTSLGRRLREMVISHFSNVYQNGNIGNLDDLEDVTQHSYFTNLRQAIDHVTDFFSSEIRYLGPLRADPGTIQQQFAPTSELDNVGSKGEYAAMVYHFNKKASIEWYNPRNQQVEEESLQTALDAWAHYLSIADHIGTEEAGAIGITWQIVPQKGCKPRSLPEVGVGISQLLPILIMGLLAPANTLLIIEQPELHLHPYAQARLGDFFMGLAKCKKQCLIETHSENLVSQLRLHIVEAGGLEKSDCMVYFVDQDERGAAQFKQIEISPNGNILNWPDGFFDETMLQEDRITAASLRKRAQKAKHGS